ncbi:MAG: hypothetical protein KDA69_11900, partial [Planctomycetaceae bacterium]|nr:hypothetical protein [Planctomycetaceae bacterium]
VQEGYENGSAWYGTQGMLIMGHTQGWRLYGPRNKLIEERTRGVDVGLHHQNFFDSIRGKATPNASIEVGHRAATIVHLANIAARTRGVLEFDPQTEQITNNESANALIQRTYRVHWATPKLG